MFPIQRLRFPHKVTLFKKLTQFRSYRRWSVYVEQNTYLMHHKNAGGERWGVSTSENALIFLPTRLLTPVAGCGTKNQKQPLTWLWKQSNQGTMQMSCAEAVSSEQPDAVSHCRKQSCRHMVFFPWHGETEIEVLNMEKETKGGAGVPWATSWEANYCHFSFRFLGTKRRAEGGGYAHQ